MASVNSAGSGAKKPGESRRGEGGEPTSRRPSVWVAGGLGLVLGFLLAASFTGAVDGEVRATLPEVGAGAPTLTGPPASTGPGEGLATLVPGFDFVLMSFEVSPSSTEMLVWPPGGPKYTNVFPAGTWGARFDAARDSVALAGRGRLGRGNVLYVGNQTTVDPFATGVLGYAWHDGDPDRLAWNLAWPVNEEGDVYRYRLGAPSPERMFRVSPGTQLVAWGSWGYALQTYGPDATVEVLDDQGAVVGPATHGLLLDSHSTGRLLMKGGIGSTDVWITGADLSGRVALATAAGDTMAGRFSPSGSMIARLAAIDESAYLEVWDGGGMLLDRTEVGEAYDAIWSPDSRFVVVAERRPAVLAFFDRVDRSTDRVPVDAAPQGIAARSLRWPGTLSSAACCEGPSESLWKSV